MIKDPDQLDKVYADADRGNTWAKNVVTQIEATFGAHGPYIPEAEAKPECLMPALREFKGAIAESCIPDWSYVDSLLSKDRPSGLRLREIVAESYSKRARELKLRNDIIINALIVVLAGWAVRSALSAEARALGVDPAAGLKPRPMPEPVKIPDAWKELSGADAAKAMGLPETPAGYRWMKTGDGRLTIARAPGTSATATKLRYYPETKTFIDETKFVTPKPEIVKPSLSPKELEDAAKDAAAARDSLKDVPEPKTDAKAADGTTKRSGWGKDIKSFDPVDELSKKIGNTPEPNPALDKAGYPGSYNLSHAEKQAAAAAAKGTRWFGVSAVMCLDCQAFFKKLAAYWGDPIVVADPAEIRVLYPDGTVISGTTLALVGAAALEAAKKKEETKP